MKKAKKLVSLVAACTLLTSSVAGYVSVSAAETDEAVSEESATKIASESNIQKSTADGVILHAFNWSYNSIKENLAEIAQAGYSTVQTSPVQQPKDYGAWFDVAGQWPKLYQPLSFSIAENSWLGTKAELTSLCEEAEKYGIKIICDVVTNHLANSGKSYVLSEDVATYEPELYNNQSEYFHSSSLGDVSDSSLQLMVQGHLTTCPDLNTGSKYVQSRVISLLEECIDCGVDGFRFDGAKHIETANDGVYASDYWENVTTAAHEYYTEKNGEDNLYIYGEILNGFGSTGRTYDGYTDYISITDNKTGNSVLSAVKSGKASTAAKSTYQSGVDASKVVLWAESHDTYEESNDSTSTSGISDENIIKAWAIVASRKDATALYFSRPGSALMGEAGTDTSYKSNVVSEINKFHNNSVGLSETLGSSGDIAYVVRGTSGIVLVNCDGTTADVSIADTGMADGTYTDTVTGTTFTVSGGTLKGSIGSTGVAVVYNGTTTPHNTCSVESGTFNGETMTVTLGLENATSGTYCLDYSDPVEYTGTVTIRIGSDYYDGQTINLTLTATDGTKTTTDLYQYKKSSSGSGVYVFFKAETQSEWEASYYCYVYDETSDKGITYTNGAWAGVEMSYDESTGYYYYEVPSTTCLANGETAAFDLAHSENTQVIISSSNKKQYPSKSGMKLGGSSKIYALTSTSSWDDTDLVPASDTVDATDVTNASHPPKPTEATTATVPSTADDPTTTTKPTSKTEPTTATTSTKTYIYGDANGDGRVDISDATTIQKHVAQITKLSDVYQLAADVDGDGSVSISDATCVQKYIAKISGYGKTGEAFTK